jgi:hypothetical protein
VLKSGAEVQYITRAPEPLLQPAMVSQPLGLAASWEHCSELMGVIYRPRLSSFPYDEVPCGQKCVSSFVLLF